MRSLEIQRLGPLARYTLVFITGLALSRVLHLSDFRVSPGIDGTWTIDWSDTLAFALPKLKALLAIVAAAILLYGGYYAFSALLNAGPGTARARNGSVGARGKVLEAVTEVLERQLSTLLSAATAHLETSDLHRAAYAKAQVNLAAADSVEKLQSIGELLISTSTAAQKEAEELRGKLSAAHAQMVEMRKQLAASERIAQLDSLTGLPNRRHFETALQDAVADAHATLLPLCLVMTDIDHFKKINDTYGHQTGDAILKQLGDILNANVRASDCVARYGGEEFALILKKTPMGNAVDIVERLRTRMKEANWTTASGKSMQAPTASFGIAEIRDEDAGFELVARADKKLYDAKRNGRNRVEIDAAHC